MALQVSRITPSHWGLFALLLALLALLAEAIEDGYCTDTEGCSKGCCGAV